MNESKVRLSIFTDTITITFDTEDMKEGKGGWDIRSRHCSQLSTEDIIKFTEIVESAHTVVSKLLDAQ
jgi:hypothetical protein|tara:strand:- start:787 stop:990 length:204 start_codon:yes stop_codon:yes gene_type:complete